MCGIAGILTTRDDLDLSLALAGMQEALRHRGPDDEGCQEVSLPHGYRLGLVHTRLAILDLSPAGHQPMVDANSGSWIVYNGEVYNHEQVRRQMGQAAFASTGDTQTILKGWVESGEIILAALRGMFAFALYDGRRQQFYLVRDRLGIKPLYVSPAGPETWIFASELRALLASDLILRQLHLPALNSYLTFGAVADPWTLIDGARSLLPGEFWCFDLSRPSQPLVPRRRRYWQPPFRTHSGPAPRREEAVEQLRPVVREATALRMVSDVPVGVFLSGGIDSSSVVASLASQGYPLHTFAVVFGERDFDESSHSRHIAAQFGTKHTELHLSPTDVLDAFDEAMAAYDQPSIDGLNTYFISRATRQAGVKVALSGLGGDELFAGYPTFKMLARLERALPRGLAWLAYWFLRQFAPETTRAAKLGAILQGDRSRLRNYTICRELMSSDRRAALSAHSNSAGVPSLPEEVTAELKRAVANLDVVNAQSLLELSLYLANMLLRDTDQMSMAHALEVREPLLDHVLVETVAALPGFLKLVPGQGSPLKGLLVDALEVPLPSSVVHRKKQGFVLPWEHWLRHQLRPRIEETLANSPALRAAGLERGAVLRLWHSFLDHRPGIRYTDILALTNLLHWVASHRFPAILACQPC
jgi:asparagine synthase (glutamine-hydrolysing)